MVYEDPVLNDLDALRLKELSYNLILLNLFYKRGRKETNYVDEILLIYKNLDNGSVGQFTIVKPKCHFYVSKDGHEYDIAQPYTGIDTVDKICCDYKELLLTIAKEIDRKNGDDRATKYYFTNMKQRNFNTVKNLHKSQFIFSSDYNIEDYYRMRFKEFFKPELIKLTKSYFDIEIDVKDSPTNKVSWMIENPILPLSVVTTVYDEINTSFTYILRNPNNPKMIEVEENIQGLKDLVIGEFGERYSELDFKFAFFDDEIDMIKSIFNMFMLYKPNFNHIWNMNFDIRYLYGRIKELGYDPKDIMCDPEIDYTSCFYKSDDRRFKLEDKDDFFYLSSYTTHIDQMINYAKVNKGGKQLRDRSLNGISTLELGDKKISYDDDGGDLTSLLYGNPARYILYNIKDVLLLYSIENKVNHTDLIYKRSYDSGTRMHKVFKQSVFVANTAVQDYPKDGFILGNNNNIQYNEYRDNDREKDGDSLTDTEKFEGAIVGDPMLNEKKGILINNQRSSFVFNWLSDMDYSSMYPLGRYSHNIGIKTELWKINIDEIYSDYEESFSYDRYDRGGNFAQDMIARNYSNIGKKWFDLPDVDDLLIEIDNIGEDEFIDTNDEILEDIATNITMTVPLSVINSLTITDN